MQLLDLAGLQAMGQVSAGRGWAFSLSAVQGESPDGFPVFHSSLSLSWHMWGGLLLPILSKLGRVLALVLPVGCGQECSVLLSGWSTCRLDLSAVLLTGNHRNLVQTSFLSWVSE